MCEGSAQIQAQINGQLVRPTGIGKCSKSKKELVHFYIKFGLSKKINLSPSINLASLTLFQLGRNQKCMDSCMQHHPSVLTRH